MSFRARIQPILVCLCLTALVLQGCNVSGGGDGGGGDGGGGAAGDGVRLSLATADETSTLVANGTDSVVIQLTATDGSGPIAGTPVHFTTSAGTLTAGGAAQAAATRAVVVSEATDSTDANGMATTTLTAGETVETATVIAEALGFSQAIRISFVSGEPATVGLSAVPNVILPGEKTTVRVIVRNADAVPVEGVTVSLSIPTNNSGGSLNPTSGTTGSSGEMFAEFTAGSRFGTDVVQGTIGNLSGTAEIAVRTTEVIPTNIQLFVSPSPQLDSDKDPKGAGCAQVVTLTSQVTDDGNNVLAGIDVVFSSNFGSISVLNGTTDANGLARAELDVCGDPTNRQIGDPTNPPITVTTAAGTLVDTEDVAVTGTTVTVSGATSAVLNETLELSVVLRDAAGDGIADETVSLESSLGNTLPATVTTDANGQVTFDYTTVNFGTDKITASALGAIGSLDLTVSADTFRLSISPDNPEVDLGDSRVVTAHWEREEDAGLVPVVGQTINFAATRGVLSGGDVSASVDTTDANGDATVSITSSNAGRSILTASAAVNGGPSTQITIEFVARNAATLFLQANPTTVGVNLNGTTDQQSTITAVVRDPAGNLVKGRTVRFILDDTTGGTLFPAQAETDSFGRASTVYTAGATSSAQDGVKIDAEVIGQIDAGCQPAANNPGGACDRVTLTVAQQQMFVVLGTGNDIVKEGELYKKPYTVLVTDVNGNPIANATVELNLFPTRYEKGFYTLFFDKDGQCVGWGKVRTVTASSTVPHPDNNDQACDNEDKNRNGFLDIDLGEDINGNGTLEPANPAAPLGTVTTNENGFGFFDVSYAREFTWVEVEIEARATVGGSEGFSTARFFLPGLATDFDNCDVAPPGQVSAYGIATTCACDELDDPNCPTRTSLRPVQFSQVGGPDNIPAAGGAANAATFSISGGGEVSYQVFLLGDSAGTLRNDDTNQAGDVINVSSGETFSLEAFANQFSNPRTLSFQATDDTTGIFSPPEDVIQLGSTPISLVRTAGPSPVPAGGATLTLTISGGTNSTYTVSTNLGNFNTATGPATLNNLVSGTSFNLVVPANTTGAGITITVTGVDDLTGNLGTLSINQS